MLPEGWVWPVAAPPEGVGGSASLTEHGADEPVGAGLSGCGTEGVEIESRALPDGAEHGWRRVGRALEQPLQEAVHQEHGGAQVALVTRPWARLPELGGRRRGEQRLGLGALLPLSVLAILLAASLIHVLLLSLDKKRLQNPEGSPEATCLKLSPQDGRRAGQVVTTEMCVWPGCAHSPQQRRLGRATMPAPGPRP